jgi:peptidyl-prolyl cis-trans isomerase SurA
MKYRLLTFAVILAGLSIGSAQVASHATASNKPIASVTAARTPEAMMQPVARVNGSVLTQMDVLREMYAIFPYARLHNGFPKDMEKEIRRGAMDMIIFEELLYQEAKRRNLSVPPERLARAEVNFRKQFPTTQAFKQHLKTELNGSPQAMREKIRRSLLIEQMLKNEVQFKSKVSLAEVKAYYDKNSEQFKHGETVAIQTISIIPPENGTQAIKDEARAKIKDVLRLARAAKTPRDFGLLAEQLSDDDWRTKLGDRGTTDVSNLPPEVVKAARAMKPGQVSEVIQLGHAYVVFRLNAHTLAGKTSFAAAKTKLQSDMQKQRTTEIRAALYQKLRKGAKIEVL